MLRLYAAAAGGDRRYFLDKTPRYHLVVRDILELFPEGRFIFLWRNPLAVIASIVNTWSEGRWEFGPWHVDIFHGLERLTAVFEQSQDRAVAIRYEDLVCRKPDAIGRLSAYLDLSLEGNPLDAFAEVKLRGSMGDQVGSREYQQLDTGPLDQWRDVFSNPLRRRWASQYLQWIGDRRLTLMGYDRAELLAALADNPPRFCHLGGDLKSWAQGRLVFPRTQIPLRDNQDRQQELQDTVWGSGGGKF